MFRGFIAVKIPFNDKFNEFWKAVKGSGAKIKLVEPNNVHITLKFLGNVHEELIPEIIDVIKNASEDVGPFKLVFKGCGAFPSAKSPRVVWIGVKDGAEALIEIAEKIEYEVCKLGFQKERRKFVPHVTVGRVKGPIGSLPSIIASYSTKDFGETIIDAIYLMKSTLTPNGPIYTVIDAVKL